MERELTRRRALAALGVTSSTLAGCLGVLSNDDEDDPDDENDTDENGNGNDTDENGNGNDTDGNGNGNDPDGTDSDTTWPAIDTGEVISDFEDLDRWEPRTGQIEAAPDEARTGTQAAVVESDGSRVAMTIFFPEPLDLRGWDTSFAVKPESVNRIVVEFIAPSGNERLASVRPIPDGYDDWFRLDCGYEHKPDNEPDLSTVTQLNVVADGPDDGPTRMIVDDLRRTEAVENGKAILAFYGGRQSHFDVAAEMLEERGWAGAVPVDPGRIGGSNRMNFDELGQLRDRGWDVCSYPQTNRDLAEQPEDRQRTVVEGTRDTLADRGFSDGARHFFAPRWRQMTPTMHAVVRDLHESGFMFGACPVGAPPTGRHMIPVIWGPALHNGVRRHINLCDQYQQLTVIRIPPIVEDDEAEDGRTMAISDFEHLLDHIEHRGLDVVTPSDVVDGTMGGEGESEDQTEMPDGTIFEAGSSHSLEGTGTGESQEFALDEGLLVAKFSHENSSEFVVEISSVDGGGRDELLVNVDGITDGESVTVVGGGTYRLDVETDGAWTVNLEQPEVHSDDLVELPAEAVSSGSSFVGPLWTESDVRVEATHDGSGPFVVDGHGADGHVEQLVNQTGQFENSRSYSAGGTVWIDVEASGDWTLEITQS